MIKVLICHWLVASQLLQMPSERAWGQKEWTRWSVIRPFLQTNLPYNPGNTCIPKAGCWFFLFLRSRMRKVTLSSPAMAPPSWSRCRCSTLQRKWYAQKARRSSDEFAIHVTHISLFGYFQTWGVTCVCGVSAGGTVQSPGHRGGWRHHLGGSDCWSAAERLQQTAAERWDVLTDMKPALTVF